MYTPICILQHSIIGILCYYRHAIWRRHANTHTILTQILFIYLYTYTGQARKSGPRRGRRGTDGQRPARNLVREMAYVTYFPYILCFTRIIMYYIVYASCM